MPDNQDEAFISRVVRGGPLESFKLKGSTATLTFIFANDCKDFVKRWRKGFPYDKRDGQFLHARVESGEPDDDATERCRKALPEHARRCLEVRAMDKSLDLENLKSLRLRRELRIAHIWEHDQKDGVSGASSKRMRASLIDFGLQVRVIYFRFNGVHDAVSFKSAFSKLPQWNQFIFAYGLDPYVARYSTTSLVTNVETCQVRVS